LTIWGILQLVKKPDKITYPPLEDHVGASLWQMSELWKARFDHEMVKMGHHYFAEARGNIMRHIGPDGVAQTTLVQRMGFSKQAVQQLLDDLVADLVVIRTNDPKDKRSKIIVLTQLGLAALHDANKIKLKIEKDYEKLIGAENLQSLIDNLERLKTRILEKQ
jgi:DNA-binding MarR family transcriptional regulator